MVDGLLKLEKINRDEYDTYMLFAQSEMGRAWFERRVWETYMDEPSPDHCIGEAFAYCDGRRGIFRNIKSTIEKINHLLKEQANERADSEQQ
ncbi:hypothetical protein KW791_00050 [Candidatus Parcubacteria bacterium]|nr:hypothetical protein [Candidatus Parcubacteria bacterium]